LSDVSESGMRVRCSRFRVPLAADSEFTFEFIFDAVATRLFAGTLDFAPPTDVAAIRTVSITENDEVMTKTDAFADRVLPG
ncbi:hypothetical protein, partial [Salmonella enterica]|uniref:hypothetical protein n=1 Tax=Salmonella enterica TaxID=28901 RepID=UPI0020C1E3D8